jgi:hypothetical protein
MATVKGILGQAAPAGSVDTDLYEVPANKNATVKVIVANRSTAIPYRIWVAVNGAATSNKQYVAYDPTLEANDAVSTVSFMLGSGDVVRVRAGSSNVSFSCSGTEQDN